MTLDPDFEDVSLTLNRSAGAEDIQVTGPAPKESETVTGVSASRFARPFVERFEQKQENEAGENGQKGMPAIDGTRVWGNLIPWAMKGGLALLDQGLITGSNFVLGIVLARWLPPDQYGAYAVAFAVFLLLLMLYQSLFLEPQAVFGASAYRGCFRGYVKALLRLHLATALLIVFVIGVSAEVALKLGQPGGLPGALAGVALAAPCILLFWLARRTSYLEFSPAPAAGGSLLYCALTLSGLYVAYRFRLLSPMSALLLMGLGALGASAFIFTYLKLRLPRTRGAPTLRDTWRRHWSYGRWALASAALMWVPWNIFYPLLSSLSGMAQAGELKALMNFTAPVLQTYTAVSSLLLPYLVRVHEREGHAGTNAVTRRVTMLCVCGAVAFWAPLLLFKGPVFRLLYSGRYTEAAYLLPVVALGSVSWSAFFGLANALRAMTSPASVFAAVLVSSCVSVMIGVPATWALGVRGAVWSIALSETLAVVMVLVLFRRKVRRTSDAVPTLPELSASS
jgi:O-antigen/teichoic acid export membrane protein